MNGWTDILNKFILQAQESDLKTSSYPKEWSDLKMRISFGMVNHTRCDMGRHT